GGVAEVPEHQAAGVVHDLGDRGGVGEVPRAVGDLAEHHDPGRRADHVPDLVHADPRGGVDVDPADGQAALGGDALHDVPVGREVVVVDDDLGTPRVGARLVVGPGPDQLVEQHRRG